MTNEELLDLVKEQCEENEVFRKQIIDAVTKKQEQNIKNIVVDWFKKNYSTIKTATINAIIHEIISWAKALISN